MKLRFLAFTLAAPFLLSACVGGASAPAPEPMPEPRPEPRPAPPPPPPPASADWRDFPLTPGTWTYAEGPGGSRAIFGAGEGGRFSIACEASRRTIILMRPGQSPGSSLTIRTTSTARTLPGTSLSSQQAIAAQLPASDRFLDAIAFSRGRFTVEAQDADMLVLPAWAEIGRVIEDCRG